MSNINRFKLKKNNARAIVLCILILLSMFSQTIGYSYGAEFQVTAKENDVLMYKLTFNDQVSYAKFEINNTIENSASIQINYNTYFAENLTGINETDAEHANITLTGSLSEDLLGSNSILNLILPTGTNFSKSESEIQEYFMNNEENVTVDYSFGSYGYSINFVYYLRFIILIKVMEMTYYYSTTGVLLLGDFYLKDPSSSSESSGTFEILPEYSTVLGADENPYNPANISDSNSADYEYFDDYTKFQLDNKAIITIVLLLIGFGGLTTVLVIFIRKKRKPKYRKIIEN